MKKILVIAILCVLCASAVNSENTTISNDKIKELISQLGSDDWQMRESAQKELTEYGDNLIDQYSTAKRDKKQEISNTIKKDIEEVAQIIQNTCNHRESEIKMRANKIRQHFYTLTSAKIAFVSERDGLPEIYVMDADGKNQTRLTKNEVSDSEPAWSPDGKKITFVSNRDNKDTTKVICGIYVMDADGKNQARLTNNESSVYMPTWSPDGKRIAFCLNRDGKEKRVKDKDDTSEIYVMGADGKNQVRLTNNKAGDTNTKPTWSPDGTKIAFCLSRCGTHEIYVMDADGKNQTRLTKGNWSAEGPAWCPVSLPEIAALFSPDTKEK